MAGPLLGRVVRPERAKAIPAPPVPTERLLAFLRPYHWGLLAAGLLLLLDTVTGLAFPLGIRQLIDSAFITGDTHRLNVVAVVLLGLFGVQAIASAAQTYLTSAIGERLITDLRIRLAGHVLRLSLSYYDRHQTGDVVSVVSNDVGLMRQGLLDAVLQFIPQIIRLLGSLALAAFLNWRLALVVVVVGPIAGGMAVFIGRRVRAMTKTSLDELGRATAVLSEALAGPRVVKAFSREAYETQRYVERIHDVLKAGLERSRIQAMLSPITGLLFAWATVAVLWFGGREVIAGRLTPGELVAFIIYFGGVAGPVAQLSRLYTQLQQALGAAQRVFDLLDEPADVVDRPSATVLVAGEGRVVFDGVTFAYAPDRPVLNDISFSIEPGQTLALVGPSGAGKTTTIALLLRLYDVTGGAILVDGQNIGDVTQASLRAGIALVPQEPVLFSASIAENIRYGRIEATDADIEEAARAANAHQFIATLPLGYASPVGERGVQLSVGQRQRVAIARAILRDPRILLLDEATASLDNESEYLVQEALGRLMAGRTTLVVAHRLTTVERADRIVVLDGGQIVEQGTPAALVAAGGLYHRLLTRSFAADVLAIEPVTVG